MFLGVEIGGTKLQLGLGRGDGRLAGLWRGTVAAADGAAGIRQQIVTALPELLTRAGMACAQLRGVGIGFGGPVDDASRTTLTSHQIAGWDRFPLATWFEDWLHLPAALANDADVAGLAEALFGAGQRRSPIFYVTVGSGIGGGLILDGTIYRGSGRGAAEIGHLLLFDPDSGLKPLEQLASGWAIGGQARRLAPGDARGQTLLRLVDGDPNRLTAAHVAQAAAEGDELAHAILDRAWDRLAEALAQVIALLCPRRIIIGGGVALIGEQRFFQPLRERVARLVFRPFADCYDIVPAQLGEEVVVHGALALARQHAERRGAV
ncbi:MAG: ROK family protein [Gemmataceae bacterium]|nr:ROK family protein [Gemmataceae bacterium]MDW8267010.1 ROK family protein [Gemmataceae bacterium]